MLVLLSWSKKTTGEIFSRKQPSLGAGGQCDGDEHSAREGFGAVFLVGNTLGSPEPFLVRAALHDDGRWGWCGWERARHHEKTTAARDSNDQKGHAASHSPVDPSDFMQLLERPSQVSLLPFRGGPGVYRWSPAHEEGWRGSGVEGRRFHFPNVLLLSFGLTRLQSHTPTLYTCPLWF